MAFLLYNNVNRLLFQNFFISGDRFVPDVIRQHQPGTPFCHIGADISDIAAECINISDRPARRNNAHDMFFIETIPEAVKTDSGEQKRHFAGRCAVKQFLSLF